MGNKSSTDHMLRKFVACVLISVMVNGCARQSHSVISSQKQRSNPEIELGESIHQKLIQQVPVYEGVQLNEYVSSIGQKIAAVAKRKNLNYRFVILEDSRIYSTHAPGGYVYVTAGFLLFLQSEIELAGVLAYEIGALQYKDPRLSRIKKVFDFFLAGGSVVAPAFGSIGTLGFLGLAVAGNVLGTQKSSAKQMLAADKRALDYLIKSGYDPQGFVDVLHRVADPECPARPYLYDFLQSHPITEKRIAKLDKAFRSLPLENKQFETGRETFMEITRSLRQPAQ